MTWVKWVMLLYGVGLIAMGTDGYFGSNDPSIESLIAGGGSGLLVLVGLMMSLKMSSPRAGYILTLVICLAIAGRFASGTFDGEMYPSTIAFGASIITMLCLVGGHLTAMKARKSEAS